MEAKIDQKLKKMLWQASKIKLTFSTVVEVSIISTKIGSFRGSADGGSVDTESYAWDGSSAPRAGWDTMLDNYEGMKLAMGYHLEKKMNCLPEQLMASFCGVSSQ